MLSTQNSLTQTFQIIRMHYFLGGVNIYVTFNEREF